MAVGHRLEREVTGLHPDGPRPLRQLETPFEVTRHEVGIGHERAGPPHAFWLSEILGQAHDLGEDFEGPPKLGEDEEWVAEVET